MGPFASIVGKPLKTFCFRGLFIQYRCAGAQSVHEPIFKSTRIYLTLSGDFKIRTIPKPMTMPGASDTFYGSIPVFRSFGSLMDPALYSPLPDDWSIGVADIVESTRAIAEARYKAVNMAGAAGIAAATHSLGGRGRPFGVGRRGARVSGSPPALA